MIWWPKQMPMSLSEGAMDGRDWTKATRVTIQGRSR